MADSILKAEVAQVTIGYATIEGLMDENGGFHVGIPQMAALNLVPPNRSQKQLESLLPEGFEFTKLRTQLNPKAVNAVPIEFLEDFIISIARQGNVEAQKLLGWKVAKQNKTSVKSQQLYLVMTDDNLYVKIGVSVNPEKRAKEIQVGCPTPVKVVRTFKTRNAAKLEQKLHKLLADYNTNGEWFDSSVLSLVDWDSLT